MIGYRAARKVWLGDLARDVTANRIRRWGQALVLAGELPQEISWLYSHFYSHARLGHPLFCKNSRSSLVVLGPCQGYLDLT